MMTGPSAEELAQMREFHQARGSGQWCAECQGLGEAFCSWPCVPVRLLDALRDAETERDEARAGAVLVRKALEGLLEMHDLAMDKLVTPKLDDAVARKHSDGLSDSERYRLYGIADVLRQVDIWLSDNEAVHPVADARAALEPPHG